MNTCRVCGDGLATPKRGRKPEFCGTRCRVSAHRDRKRYEAYAARLQPPTPKRVGFDDVPAELRALDRWIRHEAKRPIASGGWRCSVTDSSHWSSLEDVALSPYGDGVGFVLNGDGIVCIDLDDCVHDGIVDEEAEKFVNALGDTYSEFSPSGRGLHVWGYGFMEKGSRFTAGGLKVEAYPNGRFITVTGDPYRKGALGVIDLEHAVALVA